MTDTRTTTPPDEFADHAASLRRLAHALVRCPAAADDAVQETWVRAMRTPRPAVHRLGAWLKTVLQNVVISEHRSGTRRREIDRDLAESGDHAGQRTQLETLSTLDLVARRERLRLVSNAISTLSVELQTVVFLRHFDALPPREVAARLEVPVSVVHKRLRSAHAKLRRQLGDASPDGDWRAMLTGLFGLPRATVPFWTPITEGSLNMLLQAKVGIAAAALTIVAVPVFLIGGGKAAPQPNTGRPATSSGPIADSSLEQSSTSRELVAGSREPVATTEPLDEVSAALAEFEQFEFEVVVHLQNELDLPAHSQAILLGPDQHSLNIAGTTSADGELTVRFFGREPSMVVYVAEVAADARLRRITLEAGTPTHVALHHADLAHHTGEIMLDLPSMVPGRDEAQRFVTTAWTETEDVAVSFSEESIEFATATGLRLKEQPANITVRVLDARGKPAAGALIVAADADGKRQTFRANKDGVAQFTLPPRTFELRAGGEDYGIATRSLEATGEGNTEWTARLDRGHELIGRLLDLDGTPLVDYAVQASSCLGTDAWCDVTKTDENGDYSIPNAPDRVHDLSVFKAQSSRALAIPMMQFEHRPGPSQTTATAFTQSHLSSVRATIATEGLPASGLRVRVLRGGSDCGIEAKVHGHEELRLDFLPPGEYSVELGSPAADWHVAAHFRCVAGGTDEPIDLGSLFLPAPGRLIVGKSALASIWRLRDNIVSTLSGREHESPQADASVAPHLPPVVADLADLTSRRSWLEVTGKLAHDVPGTASLGAVADYADGEVRGVALDGRFEIIEEVEDGPTDLAAPVARMLFEHDDTDEFVDERAAGLHVHEDSFEEIESRVTEYVLAAGQYIARVGDTFVQFRIHAGHRVEFDRLTGGSGN